MSNTTPQVIASILVSSFIRASNFDKLKTGKLKTYRDETLHRIGRYGWYSVWESPEGYSELATAIDCKFSRITIDEANSVVYLTNTLFNDYIDGKSNLPLYLEDENFSAVVEENFK